MPRIRLLPEVTVNRIAAGEVIERPAAVVKELVENALDAGATRIDVALGGGGIERIEVTDNGVGMAADDLALCVLRHATSKLTDEALIEIATLGFRGEALPSIGAAARLEITTRPAGSDSAWRIGVEGGAVGAVAPAAGPPGTRVVVRDLFFATPARRKFQKQPRTEAEQAEAALRRLAVAAQGVAFRLESDGKTLFDLPAQDRVQRVAAILGPEAAAALMPIAHERGDMRVTGYACSPAVTRAAAVAQYLVVNNRPIADPMLRSAVRVAYRDVIAAGRYPVVALFLDVPPAEIDVNAHPAKTEVRFRDPAAARALVIGGIQRGLAGGAAPRLPDHRPALRLAWSRPAAARVGHAALPFPGVARAGAGAPSGFAEPRLPLAGAPAARMLSAPDAREPTHDAAAHPLGAVIGQVLDTYILAVAADGALVLVDQHAAHERLTHNALSEQMLAGGAPAQPLLLPAVVDLPESAARRLLDRAADLATLGLEIEAFGGGAVLVRALPAALGAPEPAPLLRDLADELAAWEGPASLRTRLDAVIARLACHGSIRAGRRLSRPEMEALLRRMEADPRAATCSHGRPTYLRFSRAEIEGLFGRR
jgi:DNA mismatch repair protein MutL